MANLNTQVNNINKSVNSGLSTLKDDAGQGINKFRQTTSKITDKIREFHNNHRVLFYIIVIIISVILLFILTNLIKKKIKWNRENPVFYRTAIDATNGFTIDNDKLHSVPQSNSTSMFFWLNLDVVGNSGDSSAHSGFTGDEVLISHPNHIQIKRKSLINNLKIQIPRHPTKDFIIKDFPMNRWFSMAIVIIDNDIEVYMDGKLIKTDYVDNGGKILLTGTDNSDIVVGPFKGKFSSFSISSTPYTPKTVRHFQRKGPLTDSWLVQLFGYLSGLESKPKCTKPPKRGSKSKSEVDTLKAKYL